MFCKFFSCPSYKIISFFKRFFTIKNYNYIEIELLHYLHNVIIKLDNTLLLLQFNVYCMLIPNIRFVCCN